MAHSIIVNQEKIAARAYELYQERGGIDGYDSGTIRSPTIDASLAALDGFRQIIQGYGVRRPASGAHLNETRRRFAFSSTCRTKHGDGPRWRASEREWSSGRNRPGVRLHDVDGWPADWESSSDGSRRQ